MVPLLGAVVLIYGLLADPAAVVRNMAMISSALPAEAGRLISEQLANVVQTAAGKKGLGLAVALAIALFGARNAAGGVISALNAAYEQEEKRSFIKVSLLAFVITAAAVLLLVLAASAVGGLNYLERLLGQPSPVFIIGMNVVGYVFLGGAAAAAAATLYRFGPSRDAGRWTWLSPGSLLFGFSWVLLTLGFSFYVSRFGNYGATYGSLSAVVVLLTWIYLSSYALLVGAEINSEFDHQTSKTPI
jgi:membrane protein